MLHELLSLFRNEDTMAALGGQLETMVDRVTGLVLTAGRHFFDDPAGHEQRQAVKEQDREVNRLEREIRKQVIAHLTVGEDPNHAGYCVLMLNVVKDLERVGDYAKNLSEVYDEGGGPLPPAGEANADALRSLRTRVEELSRQVGPVFTESDTEAAVPLMRAGKELQEEADRLIRRITKGSYDTATTVTLVLGARYYKRIAAHLVNVLTGVVMPLHKLDYYDEKRLKKLADRG